MSARVGRDGKPSVAILVRSADARHTMAEALDGRTVRDLSGDSAWRAVFALLRRPAGVVVVTSRLHAILLRAVGAHVVTACEVLDSACAIYADSVRRWSDGG